MENNSRGFTLLLSVLVISMVLSVALGMTEIAIKENQLSTLVRESEAAFHAADKGIDCALFYHIAYERNAAVIPWAPFPTSSADSFRAPYNWASVTCDGKTLNNVALTNWSTPSKTASPGAIGTTKFRLMFGADDTYPCVDVTIENTNDGINTKITSEGYNVCDVSSPRRTLRVIQVETTL